MLYAPVIVTFSIFMTLGTRHVSYWRSSFESLTSLMSSVRVPVTDPPHTGVTLSPSCQYASLISPAISPVMISTLKSESSTGSRYVPVLISLSESLPPSALKFVAMKESSTPR